MSASQRSQATSLDAFVELCRAQAAVRRFDSRPVDGSILERVLEAATRAPSARNSQPWRFVVVRDQARRRMLRDAYAAAYAQVRARGGEADTPLRREVAHLAEHFDTAAVIVAVCLDDRALGSADPAARYGSILPAVQNLCLAARAAGLGTVLTTLARREDAAVRAVLSIPADVEVVALVPVGWPGAGFPSTRRKPVGEVSFAEEWGQPYHRR